MAFRLRPLHEDTLQFAGLSNTQILILALEASQKLEWNIEELTLEGVRFDVPMSIKSHGEEITVSIQEGSDGEISVRSQSIAMQLVDYGKNRKNIQSLQKAMEEIKSTLSPEELEQKAKKMVAFGVGILEPSTLALLKWGADFGPLTLTGDWWRAITCNFIHIGAFHLLMNMYAFMYIGLWLEDLIGTRRMFISYLLTGVCSAAFSLYMHAETISAGASGAIFGLYGIFLAFLLFHHIPRAQRKALLISILLFVGYNLVYGMKAGIDNAAHIGGLLSGFLLGIIYVISYRFEKKDAQRTISIVGELGIFGIFLFSFLGLCQNIPSTYREIRKEWESGIVEAYLNGELEEENDNQPATNTPSKSSTLQMPPYTPVGNNDTWLSFYDATTNFSCQYPTNWHKITGARGLTPTAEPPFLMLVNGGNQLTAVALTYDTRKEFERVKELTLLLPRNANGEPSEDYKQSNVTINGLSMTQTSNPLHIGAPDEPGHDVQQIALRYFQEDQLRVFSIVMLVYDKEAQADLEAIVSSIQITK